jgi:UDP-glucuronate 4-epimerase
MLNSVKNLDKVALVTGSAGFIGFHVSRKLLLDGWTVIGLDCFSDYYDVTLKHSRNAILEKFKKFKSVFGRIDHPNVILNLLRDNKISVIIHLAGQAGVRHSVDNPRSYLDSNIVGTFELLEAAKIFPPKHILMASTSSVYGSNADMPFRERDAVNHQISFYAATKKSMESMAHSYSYLFGMPITVFRFFTVYGPWGRPDMALFKFTEAILNGVEINVYNYGDMKRDFTYIDDLVSSIEGLMRIIPECKSEPITLGADGESNVAPYRVVNIGNSLPEKLTDFISVIERTLKLKAKQQFLPIQPGDVPVTWADTRVLLNLTGAGPRTPIEVGIQRFIDWYKDYYKIVIEPVS